MLFFAAQTLNAAPAKPIGSQKSPQVDTQSRKGGDDKAKNYGDIDDEDSHAATHPLNIIADQSDDKAKNYGDINDEDSHTATQHPLSIIADQSDDKAKDYGDLDDDDGHAAAIPRLRVAEGDKATDYGDINDEDSHADMLIATIQA